MRKIYDCFTFFNELELLDLRLRELDSVVDYFVIVEATKTFQKKPKPLYFELNRDRYRDFAHKIIHVVVDTYPHFFHHWRRPKTWDFENNQREHILEGIKDAAPDDLILISDVDEIVYAEIFQRIQPDAVNIFELYLSFYYLNYVCTYVDDSVPGQISIQNRDGLGLWRGPVLLPRRMITDIKTARLMRNQDPQHFNIIPKAGWHFSFLGNVGSIIQKLESFSHKEYNDPKIKNIERVRQAIREGRSITDGSRFKKLSEFSTPPRLPNSILSHRNSYKHLFLEDEPR